MKLRDIRRRAKTPYLPEAGFRFIRGYKSKRCRIYVAGCGNCDEWKFYDTHGRFTYTFEELYEYMDKQEKELI
jgi:hypothetical protein